MAKTKTPGFWSDTFEQAAEFGKSTAKQSGQALKSTFNPITLAEQAFGKTPNDKGIEQLEKGKSKKQNHTPLDFQKLQDKYNNQDKAKTDALRNRLFQIVKGGDERLLQEQKQKELEKKRKDEYMIQDKKRKDDQKKQQLSGPIPQGKVRRSIFSHKKVAQRSQVEVRPASSKQ